MAQPGNTSVKAAHDRQIQFLKQCRTMNESLVVQVLLENGPVTRGEIVAGTTVKWTTAHDCRVRLQVRNLLKKEVVKAGRGRPRVYWSLIT